MTRLQCSVKVAASPPSILRTHIAYGSCVLSGAAHEAAAGHAFPDPLQPRHSMLTGIIPTNRDCLLGVAQVIFAAL